MWVDTFLLLLFFGEGVCILFGSYSTKSVDAVFQIPFYALMVYLSLSALHSLSDVPDRSRFLDATTPETFLCLTTYLKRTFLHFPVVFGLDSERGATFFHHLLTGGCVLYSFLAERDQYHICAMMLTEVSSLPLSLLHLSREHGTKRQVFLSGLSLLITFFLFRVVMLPLIFLSYRWYHLTYEVAVEGTSRWRGRNRHETEYFLYSTSTSVFYLLYLYWFAKIVRGARKMVGRRE